MGIIYTALRKSFSGPRQFWGVAKGSTGPRILIVAPGEKTMPVEGWGAVEAICFDLYRGLSGRGQTVAMLNSWNILYWFKAFAWGPTVVVNHYDIFSKALGILCRAFRMKLITVSHYGYAGFPELWSKETRGVMKATAESDLVVCLSRKIRDVWTREFQIKNSTVIPNYVKAEVFLTKKAAARRFICVGKVEPRKRQVDLVQLLGDAVSIEFVGEIVDSRFHSLPKKAKECFLGPWDRSTLVERLSDYEYLVLPSDGEADALVLYEGQAAGLGLICTPESMGAQDDNLDWVQISPLSEMKHVLLRAPKMTGAQRAEIHTHAREHYSLEKWLDAWQRCIDSLGTK
ncbi:glycosyltransferase [Aquiluna sp. KACHI24]|uniref:glycosyltransferase n=1 Tax=Aquiluna sp. KACHI24 TaxID=2968831 RepID=UPI0032099CCF